MDCIIALPGQLFRSTQIPACLWFLSRGRRNGEKRARPGETLFVDARKMGHMLDRTRRDLSQEDISRIANTYHQWREWRRLCGRTGVLQECHSRRNPPAWLRPHAWPLRGSRSPGGRRRALRG